MSFALSVTQPGPTCTERELVAAVRQGNDQAFEELYARYRSRIASYIFGMVGNHARAEDLVQEVFISALRRLRQTDQPVAFKAWIYEIAKNSCIDEFRRSRRVREVPLGAEHDRDDDDGGGEVETLHSQVTPDTEVEQKQSLADLRGAFYGLSETHHKVIVMRELAGLSYAEIGERMGMSQAMVESNLFRARRRLTEEYNELVSGRRCQSVQTIIGVEEPSLLRKLGVRQRRQVARHLAHCQPCRRQARMAGLDESFFKAPSLVGKIAALLPFPWLRWHRSGSDDDAAPSAGSSHGFSALSSIQNAARWFDPSASPAGFGRAASALAALAVAAVGGGVAATVSGQPSHPPRQVSNASAHLRSAASTSSAPHAAPTGVAASANGHAASAGHTRTNAAARHSSKRGSAGTGAGGPAKSGKTAKTSTGHGGGGSSSSSGGSGGSGSTSHSTTHSQPQLPAVSKPHTVTVGGATVTTPTVQVPKVQVPKVQVPKVQVPKIQPPAVTTPKVSVPSPTKVVKKILGG